MEKIRINKLHSTHHVCGKSTLPIRLVNLNLIYGIDDIPSYLCHHLQKEIIAFKLILDKWIPLCISPQANSLLHKLKCL